MARLVFVTGPTGAGKTTVANYLMVHHDFAHFDGDEVLRWTNPEEQEATKGMMGAWTKIWGRERPAPETWRPLLDILAEQIQRRRDQAPDKDLVASFGVYTQEQRDYLKAKLGSTLTFLVLEGNAEALQKRLADRTAEMAAAIDGRSMEEFAKAVGTTEEAMVQGFGHQQNGFEGASDESQAYSVNAMQAPEVFFREIRTLLHLENPSEGALDFDKLKKIDTQKRAAALKATGIFDTGGLALARRFVRGCRMDYVTEFEGNSQLERVALYLRPLDANGRPLFVAGATESQQRWGGLHATLCGFAPQLGSGASLTHPASSLLDTLTKAHAAAAAVAGPEVPRWQLPSNSALPLYRGGLILLPTATGESCVLRAVAEEVAAAGLLNARSAASLHISIGSEDAPRVAAVRTALLNAPRWELVIAKCEAGTSPLQVTAMAERMELAW